MNRPSRETVLLQMAGLIAQRSTCDRYHVGAVLAIEGRVISTGYNGPPSGQPHCNAKDCDVSKACVRSVHAEANAIAFAASEGIATRGASAYLQISPCKACAELLINAGIRKVYFLEPYRDPAGLILLRASGVITYHWKDYMEVGGRQ